jgi:hypothetical protein
MKDPFKEFVRDFRREKLDSQAPRLNKGTAEILQPRIFSAAIREPHGPEGFD